MVALNVDFSSVNPSIGGGLPVKPEGWYHGRVIETKAQGTRDSQQTGNAMLVCVFALQDGSKYEERYNLWHQKDDTKRIAYENLAALLAGMGLSGTQLNIGDTSQFHNLPVDIYLTIQESKTDQGKTLQSNRISATRNAQGKVFGQVPTVGTSVAVPAAPGAAAPQFQAPAAPPAAPPQGAAQPWGAGAPQGGAPAAPAAPAPGFPAPGAAPGGFPAPGAAPGGFPAPGAAPPGGGFPAPGAAPAGGGFPAPGAAPGGFGVPGAPAGGFPAPGAGGPGPWGGPQQ